MIGYLKGEILEIQEGRLILGVGGVGYLITALQGPSHPGFSPGSAQEFFIHTHVREDVLDLYGFSTRSEKDLFLTLLTVNGIGPKGAMGILSKVDPAELIGAIVNDDKESLHAIPGIGKKTAERVVVELGDTIRKKVEAGVINVKKGARKKVATETTVLSEAKDALLGLGFKENEIAPLLKKVIDEFDEEPTQVEAIIKSALRQTL